MPVINPNPKRIPRADAQSTKPKLSRDGAGRTEWYRHKDDNGFVRNDLVKRKIDHRYTPTGIDMVAWIREKKYAIGPNGGPGYSVFEYAVVSNDKRTMPKAHEFMPIPEDRDTPGRAVRYVENQFKWHKPDGTVKTLPHTTPSVWHTSEPHPDDAPTDVFSEKEIEVFRKREAQRNQRG